MTPMIFFGIGCVGVVSAVFGLGMVFYFAKTSGLEFADVLFAFLCMVTGLYFGWMVVLGVLGMQGKLG